MGRPLAKRFFGRLNTDTTGAYSQNVLTSDAELGGQPIASVTVNSVGSYTQAQAVALVTTIPAPLLASEGAVTATTSAATFAYLSGGTLSGSQTQAYLGGAGNPLVTQTIDGSAITLTPTLTTYSGFSIGSVTTGGVVTLTGGTITAIKGTSVIFDAGLTGTTGLTAGATYYLTASVSTSSTVTLASSYANAIAGTAISIAGGTPTGTLTLTIGTTYASIASVALAANGGGAFLQAGMATVTGALTTTQATSSGAGATFTVTSAAFGVNTININGKGDGYLPATVGTGIITSAAATSQATSITSSTTAGVMTVTAVTGTITNGMIMSGGTGTAGAYVIQQLTGSAGALVDTAVAIAGGAFDTRTVSVNNGNASIVTGLVVSGTGIPAGTTVNAVTLNTAVVTGATALTANTVTVTGFQTIANYQQFVVGGSTGSATTNLATGTYYIYNVQTASGNTVTTTFNLATSYSNAVAGTQSTFTAGTIGSLTFTLSTSADITLTNVFTGNVGALGATLSFYTPGGVGTYSLGINDTTKGTAISAAALVGTYTTGTLNPINVTQTVDMSPGATFTPQVNVGGLTGGTVYYITTVQGPTSIQVATTPGATSNQSTSATAAATGTLASFAFASSTTVSFTSTTVAIPVGTPITVSGTATGTGTINGSVPTAGTVYYAGGTSTTGATLYTSVALAIAAGTGLTIVAGNGFTGLTFTYAIGVSAPFGQNLTMTLTSAGSTAGTASAVRATANTSAVGQAGQNAYPAIQVTAYLNVADGGIQPRQLTDIIQQKGSRRYRVENIDGSGTVNLTDVTPISAGFMTIQATDSAGGTYYITKLTKNGAVLTQRTGTQFATGQRVIWTTGTAVLNTSVTIDNQ
jgi:S-layer protein